MTVRGNWDSLLATPDPTGLWPPARWWHDEVGATGRAWLAGLPNTHEVVISGRRIRLVHASATACSGHPNRHRS